MVLRDFGMGIFLLHPDPCLEEGDADELTDVVSCVGGGGHCESGGHCTSGTRAAVQVAWQGPL